MKIFAALLVLAGIPVWQLDLLPYWEVRPLEKTSIEAVASDPGSYVGRRLRMTGNVKGRITLLGFSAFVLEDLDGNTLDVVGYNKTPEPGEMLTVTGEVKMVSILGSETATILFAQN